MAHLCKRSIQESKNSTKNFLPSISDIKDGLFKLILFANLDSLEVEGRKVAFSTRLKLTGNKVRGSIRFPCKEKDLENFASSNGVSRAQFDLTRKLNLEATQNKNLTIEIGGNDG